MDKSNPQSGYDSVAEHYATEFFDELSRKPFDRQLLDEFAQNVKDKGPVYEFGCGPGQVARYLQDRGVEVHGVDLSAEMVRVANRLNPDIPFTCGNMMRTELPDDSLAAVVLFYSIIHIQRNDVTRVLKELNRILRPGGTAFLAFHRGAGELHRDEWYGEKVSIDFRLFQPEEMAGYFKTAGFAEVRTIRREPYEFEHPTERIYMFARK